MSLNNLANRQAEAGDRAAALATSAEAVEIRRTLAEASPAAYLPDLARSLNNLAIQQAEAGDRRGRWPAAPKRSATTAPGRGQPRRLPARPRQVAEQPGQRQAEAGDGRRAGHEHRSGRALPQLAEASPAAYLPDLAMSLNNLADRLGGGRGPGGALAASTRRSDPRQLAEASPAAYLPDLAMSLNNLANRRRRPGTGRTRWPRSTEAVQHPPAAGRGQPRRLPARPRQVAEQPGQPQAEAGDRAAALATSTKPSSTAARWPRPAPPPTCPTSPGR